MRAMILMLSAIILLTGCSDDTVAPVDTSYSVTVTVVDPTGAPLEGMNVNIVNDVLIDTDKAQADPGDATVVLPIQVLEQAQVRVLVRDLDGETVRTIVSTTMQAGRNIVQWDGRNDDGEPMPSSRYTLAVIAFPAAGSTPLFSDSVDVFLQRGRDDHILGTTDADGVFSTTDTHILPGLFVRPDMIATNEVGERIGTVGELETATISVWRGNEGVVYDAIAVTYGPNALEIVYDPAKAVAVETVSSRGTFRGAPHLKADEPQWGLDDPYPNPFN